MGKRIKCPACGHEFHVHGAGEMPGQELVECYECGTLFNHRKQSAIPTGGET
jgi:predicted Zn finger-like uncharacterized protein